MTEDTTLEWAWEPPNRIIVIQRSTAPIGFRYARIYPLRTIKELIHGQPRTDNGW